MAIIKKTVDNKTDMDVGKKGTLVELVDYKLVQTSK